MPTTNTWRAPPRRRWSRRDGQRMVSALVASGQNLSEFARTHSIPLHKVHYWTKLLDPADPAIEDLGPETPLFVPVVLDDARQRVRPSCAAMTLVTPGGWRIRMKPGFDRASLCALIAAVTEFR